MTCKLHILLLSITFFAFSKNIYSQSAAELRGKVINSNQQPLYKATVLLQNDNKEVARSITDSLGNFMLSYNGAGTFKLIISHTGHKNFSSSAFTLQTKNFGVIELTYADSTLTEVVVESKQNLVELEGNSIVYNVSKSIDAQGTNAFDALKKAPGVYIENEAVISLNGKQGPLILIDGRQTYLSGKELIDLLKSMPSSNIKSFEIIGSSGAKYDASGAAGIINIKTAKNIAKGFTGTATVGLSYGVYIRNNVDFTFNYRRNKINIYGSYNHFLGNYSYLYGNDRLQNSKEYNSFTDDVDKRRRLGARLGFDYTINKKNTIGILLNSNYVFGGGITDTRTDIHSFNPENFQVLEAINDYYFQQTDRYTANINYKYEDSAGRIFNIDADYGNFKKGNANLQSNIYLDNNNVLLSNNYYRILNDIGIDLKGIKFDYTTNLAKGRLEAGAKFTGIDADNDSRFFHVLNVSDSFDQRRSNTFGYNEQINSGYLSYRSTWGKWTLQGGLRLEKTTSNGVLQFKYNNRDSLEEIDRSYTNLFPSFSIGVQPKKGHNFSLSYTKRIDRPAYQDLNPFVYLLDELSFWQGNPFLLPQLTHRTSLQYIYKNATVIGFNYSHTDGYTTRITDTIENEKIVMIYRNLGVQKNYAFTVSQSFSPVKGWDLTFNGLAFFLHNKISFDKYRNFDLKQSSARLSLQQTIKLPHNITGEINATYNSKRLTGANDISRSTSIVDVGVQKKFLNDKATLRIVVNDIYKGSKSNAVQSYGGFYLRSYAYYETRQLRVNFTYRFTNNNVKGPRTRSSSLETENGRIK